MKPFSLFLSTIILIYFFVLPNFALSAEPARVEISADQRLQKANEAYSSGKYDEAINDYKTIIAEFGFSANILYNLGNSYAQKGQSGQAILQYLRGIQLDPQDSDMEGNLQLTRKNIGLFEETPTVRHRFFNLLDMNQWALLSLTSFVLITSLLAINIRFPIKRGAKTGGSLLLLATVVVSIIGVYQQRDLWNGAVITAPDTRLLMSPFESASSLGAIQEGSLVYSEKNHENYQYINDRKGRSGWIPATSLESLKVSYTTYYPTTDEKR